MKELFNDKQFYKKLWSTAFPIAMQALLLACVGASDTIMLGHLEQNAMAAVSLATQIQFVQNLMFTGIIEAFSILGSQYRGKGNNNSVNLLFFMTFRISVTVSLIFSALCFFCPKALMTIFTNEELLIEYGIGYLKIASLSYLMTGFSQCFLAHMKLSGRAAETAKISILTVFLNIALNAILIFGFWGLPRMGIKGAALATTISRIIEMAASLYFCITNKQYKPDFSQLTVHDKNLWADFSKQLLPLMGAYTVWTLGITAYSAFMGHLGADAAASNSLIIVVRNLLQSFTKGIACGTVIIVGSELGAGNHTKAKTYADRLIKLSIICGLFLTIVTAALIHPTLLVIELSKNAAKDFKKMMYILAIYMLGCSFNSVVIDGIFESGGDTKFNLYSLIIVMWCIAVPLAALGAFVFNWSTPLVFACTCLDEIGKIPIVIKHYKKEKWLRNLTR